MKEEAEKTIEKLIEVLEFLNEDGILNDDDQVKFTYQLEEMQNSINK